MNQPLRRADAIATLAFALVIAVIVVFSVAEPLYQLLRDHGPLYYENGFDESSYLQYGFSKAAQALTRPGQYLVTLAHELGLSGGTINFLADVAVLTTFPLLVRAAWRRAGWSAGQAGIGAIGVVVLPQLVLLGNPLVARLYRWALDTGMVYWITFPISANSPLARTPEPQVSLMLLAAATWLALRWRRHWPVYAVLPFMYPFVAIPVAFTVLACHLHARWPWRGQNAGPLLVAALAIGAACGAYYALLVSPVSRLLVVASREPMLSLTAAVALAAAVALRGWIRPEHRFFALALALSPLVGANQQLISGYLPQPYSFDYYYGCVALAVVIALALRDRRVLSVAVLAIGLAMFLTAAYQTFRLTQGFTIRLPLTPELATALREDSAHVVVNDPINASILSMLYPKQAFTALATDRTYSLVSEGYIAEYRCVKRQLRADYGHAFDSQTAALDRAYLYGFQDYVFGHVNRRTTPYKRLLDPSAALCREPGPVPLRYFFINWSPPPPRLTPAPSGATGRSDTRPSSSGTTR